MNIYHIYTYSISLMNCNYERFFEMWCRVSFHWIFRETGFNSKCHLYPLDFESCFISPAISILIQFRWCTCYANSKVLRPIEFCSKVQNLKLVLENAKLSRYIPENGFIYKYIYIYRGSYKWSRTLIRISCL